MNTTKRLRVDFTVKIKPTLEKGTQDMRGNKRIIKENSNERAPNSVKESATHPPPPALKDEEDQDK